MQEESDLVQHRAGAGFSAVKRTGSRVALLDAEQLGPSPTVLVAVRTNQHNKAWLERLAKGIVTLPQVQEAYRMAGDTDYLLRVVVADIAAYKQFLMDHLTGIPGVSNIVTSFALKQVKYRTALPLIQDGDTA